MILTRQSEILLTTSNSNRYEPHLIFLQVVLLCVLDRPVLARFEMTTARSMMILARLSEILLRLLVARV